MNLFDLTLTLDKQHILIRIEWDNPRLEQLYDNLLSSYISHPIEEIFTFSLLKPSGKFIWKSENFHYYVKESSNEIFLFIKRANDREYLLSCSLDLISEGIQIYDKNAYAVYFNRSSRAISNIPPNVSIENRHLLDLYDLDENVSTVMTTLRTSSPVTNRVDHYKTVSGDDIATSNTAYPILLGKELMGAVVFEQTTEIVKNHIRRMEVTQKALQRFDSTSSPTRFAGYTFEHIIGQSKKLREAVFLAQKISSQNCNVLLVGETGTGKEVFAQSIHRDSTRRNKQFIALNCAAFPETLVESLLFGTEKGSFTGSEDKPGYFQQADGGTLFLDELNSMSLTMQSKILRVIQESTYRRVGGQKDLHTDIRIISSFNEDPFQSIAENRFRRDLFYRLSTVMIDLPPLREHIEDLEELIHYHLCSNTLQFIEPVVDIKPEVLGVLRKYHWPGNVRELFHVLDYAQNITDDDTISLEHLPKYLLKNLHISPSHNRQENPPLEFGTDSLQAIMDDYECQVISQALDHYGGNITQTAQALGIRRQSLQYRIKKYGLIL